MEYSLRGRRLDHNYCVLRMNAMEKIAYDALISYQVSIDD